MGAGEFVPSWSDFGNIWTTLREIDVSAIRDEAERPVTIAAIGHSSALAEIERLLIGGGERYPAEGLTPLASIAIEQAPASESITSAADLLIVALDGQTTLSQSEADAFRQVRLPAAPTLTVLVGGAGQTADALALPRTLAARSSTLIDPQSLDAADRLATAVLQQLPAELHLAAARRLPGLRAAYSRDLVGSVSFTNASYSLATGIPEMLPILNIPFAAADIIVLTKNQALLVYRLALAHGAPPDFQARVAEVLPVIGGAFLWRQLARGLVGLIPVWGLVPKIAIAYAGTYTVGIVAWRWYASGELVSTEQIRRISKEALAIGQKRAAEIVERAKALQARDRQGKPGDTARGPARLLERLRIRRRKPEDIPESGE